MAKVVAAPWNPNKQCSDVHIALYRNAILTPRRSESCYEWCLRRFCRNTAMTNRYLKLLINSAWLATTPKITEQSLHAVTLLASF